ncbi:hypothetical protein POTOM_061833 [Populus tomentosa]|uniref:non-specific serine/threonine protein kinase n=1 Tax=Populus tomentosa TaxID=118781 RepID=A0A8X7XP63_POPTO|nr:hypothetical protein POTOM_061833 [Populus tomentosa]
MVIKFDNENFEPINQEKHHWNGKKPFEIIMCIAQGILYLHQDSRLRIIHRDLKKSYILLDKEMDARISDFGTARIFGEPKRNKFFSKPGDLQSCGCSISSIPLLMKFYGTSSTQNLFCQIDMEIFNFEMEKSDNQQDQLEFKDRGENALGDRRTRIWTGVPILQVRINFNISFVNNDDELTITWGVRNRSIFSRLVVDEPGSVQRFTWHEQIAKWDVFWSAPTDRCDNYGRCGAYGKCDPYDAYNFECTCLPGYQPKAISDWYLRDGSGGCIEKNLTGMCNNGEGFVKVENVKVPDPSTARVDNNLDLKACMEQCLRNCSCTAYASSVVTSKSGCFSWYGNLLDTRVFAEGGQDLYVRVDALELANVDFFLSPAQYDKKSRGFLAKKGMLAGLVLSIAAAVFFVIMFLFWLIKRKKTGKRLFFQLCYQYKWHQIS